MEKFPQGTNKREEENEPNRRTFLKFAAAGVGTVALAGVGRLGMKGFLNHDIENNDSNEIREYWEKEWGLQISSQEIEIREAPGHALLYTIGFKDNPDTLQVKNLTKLEVRALTEPAFSSIPKSLQSLQDAYSLPEDFAADSNNSEYTDPATGKQMVAIRVIIHQAVVTVARAHDNVDHGAQYNANDHVVGSIILVRDSQGKVIVKKDY